VRDSFFGVLLWLASYDRGMSLPPSGPTRTALITGASSGIGAAIAAQLAARGHGVTLAARRLDRLQVMATELAAAHGIRAEAVAVDLTDESSRNELVAAISAQERSVNILVNNAGLTTLGSVATADIAGELAMIRTNVEAVAHLCTALVPAMVERRSGAVLNVASTAAFQPVPGQAGYGATKAFVLSYTHALRAELRGSGVSVTALCPGPVETGFAAAAGLTDEQAAESLPGFLWVPVDEVAAAAVAGMVAGKAVVVPGAGNRLSAAVGWLTPRAALLPVLARRHPSLTD